MLGITIILESINKKTRKRVTKCIGGFLRGFTLRMLSKGFDWVIVFIFGCIHRKNMLATI